MPRLLLLHGANGTPSAVDPLATRLRPRLDVDAPCLLGHGGRDLSERPTVRAFADDVIAYLDRHEIDRTAVCGYSFGGYVALYLARHFPTRISAVSAIATRVFYDAEAVRHFVHLASPARLGRPGNPRKDELIAAHHPQDWIAVTTRTQAILATLGESPSLEASDLRAIKAPALIVSGDRDALAPPVQTTLIASLLPNARTWIFPGRAHPLGEIPLAAVANMLVTWVVEVTGRSGS